ncbi:MAG TPA: hypothetical protein VMU10_05160 [Desulfomonilia bacterium]|nr:hypothetical protein [Desulfomonilia bacterium]
MIEKIPFLHRKQMYNIIIEDDITFMALHYILDDLIGQGAFQVEEGIGELYTITHEEVIYTIGVDGTDVIISVK